jgi:FAD/FMN-containing dehydrogenase
MVDASGLRRILSVDIKRHVAIAEANVAMDELVDATLSHGLIPAVVMEFPGITVGGGIQGGAGESSSFKWGCFNKTANWYEMILPDAQVVTVSPDANADLYYGSAGSCGSLGIVTAAEIQLVKAASFVELTYIPTTSFSHAVQVIEVVSQQGYDFIDGILFAQDQGVIMVGKLTDRKTGPKQRFSRARDPWFYLHAQDIAKTTKQYTEHIPVRDYLFRYDRGAFWMGGYGFKRFQVPFNGFTRWMLDPLMKTRKMYQALQESGASQQYIVQDLAIPTKTTVAFLDYIHETIKAFPLWLCPLLVDQQSPLQSNYLRTQNIINVGVWTPFNGPYKEFVKANRDLEQNVNKLGGRKWLYAHAYYTEHEFWNIYDKHWYDKLRKKYSAQSLPTIYEKVHVSDEYTRVSVKRGIVRALLTPNKLRLR